MSDMTGSALYVSFKGTVISGDFREWKDGGEMGLVDASAGADTNVTYLSTLIDGNASFKGLYQGGTAATDIYNLCVQGAAGTLIVGPEGTATGKPKMTINNAIVKKRERSIPYKDVVELSIDFQYSAAISDSAF